MPRRAEIVVGLPVEGTTRTDEGLTEKQEVREAVYFAGALTKLQAGCTITSIVNTVNEMVEIEEPALRVADVEPETLLVPSGNDTTGCYLESPGELLKRLR